MAFPPLRIAVKSDGSMPADRAGFGWFGFFPDWPGAESGSRKIVNEKTSMRNATRTMRRFRESGLIFSSN
jgi:hypothetical protein